MSGIRRTLADMRQTAVVSVERVPGRRAGPMTGGSSVSVRGSAESPVYVALGV